MLDFSVAHASGLTQSELAKVLGVSRVTVNLWMNGKTAPHRLHSELISSRMALLATALDKNLIPKRTDKRKPRFEAIEQALKQAADTTV